jgi:hypothetical protein
MRREVWVTALVGWVACAEDGGALATPAVRLVVPEGGVRVGAGPACAAETRAGWTHGRLFWDRDGVEVPGDAAGPAPGEWAKGDTLVCVVAFTHDSTGARLWVRSDEAVVGNAAPTAPSVSGVAGDPRPRATSLRCEAAATRPGRRRRSRCGGRGGSATRQVDGGRGPGRSWFPPGAEVRCEVVATDGVDDGQPDGGGGKRPSRRRPRRAATCCSCCSTTSGIDRLTIQRGAARSRRLDPDPRRARGGAASPSPGPTPSRCARRPAPRS